MRGFRSLVLWCSLIPSAALARPITVEGTIVETTSRWTSDGSRIVTEAIVRTADGAEVTVSQLGGTVDGLTMRTFPGPEPLEPGMRIAASATERLDLSGRMHVAIDSARVLSTPPGFVRTGPTKAGNYLFWESGCVFVRPSAEGTAAIPGDEEFQVIDAAIRTWNDGTASCSYMNIVTEAREVREVGRDNVNVIKFRDQPCSITCRFCVPATGDDPQRCHADSAAGLTTAVFVDDSRSDRDGAIVDADIELNGVNFAIAVDGQSNGNGCKAELQNTLTHELGHLLGLEHPCRVSGDPPRVDHNGAPVPMCNAVLGDPSITEATMFNFQDCGEDKKETLSQDDINALCSIYPKEEDPGTCERVGDTTGCCSASGDGGVPLGAVLGGGVLGAMLLRRRRTPPARRS